MTQQALYPLPKIKAFILSEATGNRSRENAVVTQAGAALVSGTILSEVKTGAATFAMDAGSTGNPTSSAITVGVAAQQGAYKVVFEDATHFTVEDPLGVTVGAGVLGTSFNKGGLTFTLTAGGTPAVAGSTATVTVAAPTSKKYVPYTANGAAGSADAVLYNTLPAYTGDKKAVVFNCDVELNRFELTGLDATAEAGLKVRGMKVRGTAGLPTVSTPTL